MAEMQAEGSGEQAAEINGVTAIIQQVTVDKPSACVSWPTGSRTASGRASWSWGAKTDGKALLIVVVTKDLIPRFTRAI
jgi:hypothetical protein